VKTPLPLLIAFAIGVTVFLRRERGWSERVLVLGPIVLFLGASCFDTANIGLRRVLPIYPFVILVAAQAVNLRAPSLPKTALLAVLAVWQLVSVGRVTPHHLSYFNELVGGPTRGMLHLDDSNIDWARTCPRCAGGSTRTRGRHRGSTTSAWRVRRPTVSTSRA
jgi:hypothetical protein